MNQRKQQSLSILLFGVLVCSMGVPQAEEPFIAVGFVSKANPASKAVKGFTESSNPCGASHPLFGDTGGVDGAWIALPPEVRGRPAHLRTDALDADVWFYRATESGCVLVEANDDPNWRAMVTELTAAENGVIPAIADYAIVNVAAGNGVAYTLTVD